MSAIASFLLSLMVKEFWKSVNIWRNCGQEYSVSFFLTHGVVARPHNWHEVQNIFLKFQNLLFNPRIHSGQATCCIDLFYLFLIFNICMT